MNIITNNYHGTAIDNRYSVRPAFNHQCCMSTCSGINQDNFYNGQFGHVNKKSGGSCQHFHFLENRSPASATIVTSLATVTRRRDGTASGLGKQETKELCMNSAEKVKAPTVQKVNLAGAPVTRVLLSLRFLLVHTLSPQADGLTLNSNQICF